MTIPIRLPSRVKNRTRPTFPRDFSLNPLSFLLLGLFLLGGVLLQHYITGTPLLPLLLIVAGMGGQAIVIALFPAWSTLLFFQLLLWATLPSGLVGTFLPQAIQSGASGDLGVPWILGGMGGLGMLLSCSLQLISHWDRVVILRFGKFHSVKGAGLFFLLPLVDRVANSVDTRIRATDFSAEKTITQDTVPVHVDALAFWMIWDAQKAVLEVENYLEAVVLSAQAALRDSIGRYDLATLLANRESLGKEIREALDAKTNPWGITILSVEFTDIIIPQGLEDAMSKQAQAARERHSRVILSEAEVDVAEKFDIASQKYKNNPTALQLRAMNMIYEGLRQKGSLMILPSSALDGMNLGTVMAAEAITRTDNKESEDGKD